jgi:hypothetical protein
MTATARQQLFPPATGAPDGSGVRSWACADARARTAVVTPHAERTGQRKPPEAAGETRSL